MAALQRSIASCCAFTSIRSTLDQQIYALTLIEMFRYGRPRYQEDCCAVAARVNVSVQGIPQSDGERLSRALGVARGLFGPAFLAATDAQRWEWVDMCEQALLDAERTRRR